MHEQKFERKVRWLLNKSLIEGKGGGGRVVVGARKFLLNVSLDKKYSQRKKRHVISLDLRLE